MSASEDRCCGSGVCIIDDAGRCWCGQIWDGEKMVMPENKQVDIPSPPIEKKPHSL